MHRLLELGQRVRITLKTGVPAIAILLLASKTAIAQQVSHTTALDVIRTVMEHRLYWEQDTTKFSACQVFEYAGRPPDLTERLGSLAETFIGPVEGDPCANQETRSAGISIYGLSVEDSTVHLRLRIFKGEYAHVADYSLLPGRGVKPWRVHQVLLHGWTQFSRRTTTPGTDT